VDKSIERIIRRVLEEAWAKGRDHLTQTELAVKAVCAARPDMTASDGGLSGARGGAFEFQDLGESASREARQ
jgi:hypothetical protein